MVNIFPSSGVSNSGIFAIAGTVVGALITALISVYTLRMTLRSQHEKTLRDDRRTAYAEFLDHHTKALDALDAINRSRAAEPPDEADVLRNVRTLHTELGRLYSALQVVQLVCAPTVWPPAHELTVYYGAQYEAAEAGRTLQLVPADVINKLVRLMREDLAAPPPALRPARGGNRTPRGSRLPPGGEP